MRKKRIAPKNGYTKTSNHVEYRGERYPLDPQELVVYMERMGLSLKEQIQYLRGAFDAYSVGDMDKARQVLVLAKERDELLEQYNRTFGPAKKTIDEAMSVTDWLTGDAGRRTPEQEALGNRIGALPERQALAPTLVPPQALPTFYVREPRLGRGDVEALSNGLVKGRFLGPPGRNGPPPLVVAFGEGGNTQLTEPLVWLGQENQLHALIAHLVGNKYIGCHNKAHWELTAKIFIPSEPGKRYNAKGLCDASRYKYDDEQRLMACLPAQWKEERCKSGKSV